MTVKTISRSTYLQALGLFTIAQRHSQKADEFRKELGAVLGIDPDGHLADSIYEGRSNFDEALKRDGIALADETA